MTSKLLFPPVFRIAGVILLLPGLILGYLFLFQNYVLPFLSYGPPGSKHDVFNWTGQNNLTDEVAVTLVITGFIFIAFSKFKNELGLIHKLRLKALYWAILVNCALSAAYVIINNEINQHNLLFSLIIYQLFFPLPIFIFRFYYLLNKVKKGYRGQALYCLPYRPFNLIGKIACLIYLILGIAEYLKVDIPDYISLAGLPFVLLWISSKEKNENEAVTSTRLKAMQIAIYVNYGLFLLATWIFYGFDYLTVLFICLISIQFIFIVVFYFFRYRARKKSTSRQSIKIRSFLAL